MRIIVSTNAICIPNFKHPTYDIVRLKISIINLPAIIITGNIFIRHAIIFPSFNFLAGINLRIPPIREPIFSISQCFHISQSGFRQRYFFFLVGIKPYPATAANAATIVALIINFFILSYLKLFLLFIQFLVLPFLSFHRKGNRIACWLHCDFDTLLLLIM